MVLVHNLIQVLVVVVIGADGLGTHHRGGSTDLLVVVFDLERVLKVIDQLVLSSSPSLVVILLRGV